VAVFLLVLYNDDVLSSKAFPILRPCISYRLLLLHLQSAGQCPESQHAEHRDSPLWALH